MRVKRLRSLLKEKPPANASTADLVLDGFGVPDAPARVLRDPHALDPPGRLDVETLRRLAARGSGG